MMKKSIILSVLALIALPMSAQSDFEIAQSFMSQKGIKLASNEHSFTRTKDTPYSIFNGSEDKGFCIVVNGKIFGYDTENTIDENGMPCCLKELINIYSKIYPSTRGNGTNYPDWYEPKDVKPIEPMITTHWHQNYPFNEYCLVDDVKYKEDGTRDSTRGYAGCTSIGLAQLMTYYKPEGSTEIAGGSFVVVVSANPKLKRGDVITTDSLPATKFDWNKIELKNSYDSIKLSKDSLDAIAKLVLYCARLCNVTFSVYGGSVGKIPGERGLIHFGFNEEDILSAHTDEEISSESFDYYLEKGCPIIGGSSGHCLLLDGRNEIGMYHLNFGWGGNSDGYYAIYNKNIYDNINGSHEWMTKYLQDDFDCTVITSNQNVTNKIANIINTNKSNNIIYNLQGIKVGNSLEGLPKGVYIQNRKKQVVK